MSTVFNSRYIEEHAVDGITLCKWSQIAATKSERAPWLRIGLKRNTTVWKVLLYNRQDGYGTIYIYVDIVVSLKKFKKEIKYNGNTT